MPQTTYQHQKWPHQRKKRLFRPIISSWLIWHQAENSETVGSHPSFQCISTYILCDYLWLDIIYPLWMHIIIYGISGCQVQMCWSFYPARGSITLTLSFCWRIKEEGFLCFVNSQPRSKKVLGSIPGQDVSVQRLRVLPVSVWVLSRFCSFLPQSKDT